MKIVFFSSTGSQVGGAAICLKEILIHCIRMNVEPYVILRDHGNFEEFLNNNNIRYSVIKSFDWLRPMKDHGGLKNEVKWKIKEFWNLLAEHKMRSVLKREKPDVYHINVIYNSSGAKSAITLGIPIIWHLREFVEIDGNTPYFRNAKKSYELISKSKRIICVSDCIKEFYSQFVPNDRIVRIYDGIEPPAQFKKRKLDDIIKITLSGSAKVKGHEDLIKAASILKKDGISNFVISIAGKFYDEDYLTHLKHITHSYNLDDNVIFPGFQSDMNSIWEKTNICVVCSRFESFGLSVVEAMARAIPVICAKTTGSYEVTNQGEYSELYEIGDYYALAEKMKEVICNYRDYSDRAYNIAPIIAQKYSIEESCRELINVCHECVEMR